MKKGMLVLSGILAVVMGVTACGTKSTVTKEVKIRIPSALVGTHPSAQYFAEDIAQFNTMYEGKYEAEIEEIPGDANFADKMSIMLTAGDVPDVVFPTNQQYFERSTAAGKVLALNEYLDKDPEWKNSISESGLKYNSRNGKIYAIPRNKGVLAYYYNKELFEKAGIKPAQTWDEFWSNCDKLKAEGIMPIALEPTWVGNIIFSAVLSGLGEDGYALSNQDKPENYNNKDMIEALKILKKMYTEYTDESAIVSKYDNAANKFMNSGAAIIANGIWMTNDFADKNKAPEGFLDKVGIAIFPGVTVAYDNLGIGIGAETPEKIEASLACLKLLTSVEKQASYMNTIGEFPDSPKVEITEELMEKKPLMAELWNMHKKAEKTTNLIGNVWYANVTETFSTLLPNLVSGAITPEELVAELEEEVKKAAK